MKGYKGAHSGVWCKRRDSQTKTGERFPEKLMMVCAFHWGSYTFLIIRQCLNKVLLKVKRWYFAMHLKLSWKLKYPEIKPRKKRSKKTLSNVYIHFRELKFTLRCPVWKLCLWGIFEVLLRGATRLVVSKEMTSKKTGEKLSEQRLCDVCIHLVELHHSLNWVVWNPSFCGTWERTFWNAPKNMLKKKYPPIKTRRKHSVKPLQVISSPLTQLSFRFHWSVS